MNKINVENESGNTNDNYYRISPLSVLQHLEGSTEEEMVISLNLV